MGHNKGHNKHYQKIKKWYDSIQVNGRNHFTTIAKQIEVKLITSNFHFSNYLSEPVEETLPFRAMDKLEVTSTINSLNAGRVFGPANIPNNFLKLFKNKPRKPISLLANISFNMLMLPTFSKQHI